MVQGFEFFEDYDVSQADTRAIFGDQGQGKTCASVAIVVDDCYSKLTGIIKPDTGEYYKARPLNDEEKKSLRAKSVRYNPLKHIRIFSNTDNSSKIISKPDGWMIDSPVKVFSNFHFYGIRFWYVNAETVIENVNNDTITNAWLVLDEGFLTDKHESMTKVTKVVEKFGAQGRRRKLHTIIIAQYADMIQSRWNRFATTRIQCSYDKFTHTIDLEVNRNSDFMQSTSFYAPNYWKFYRHDEIVKQAQYNVDKVMKEIYS
jgi:hypothetical protein